MAGDADLDWRPIERKDAAAWSATLIDIQHADRDWEFLTEQDLLGEFGHPDHDFPRGSMGAFSGGAMAAFGTVTVRSEADPVHDMRYWGGVHPEVRVVPFSPEVSEDARCIRNEAFADHWGSTETSAEAWAHHMTSGTLRPGFSFVAYAGAEPAGFVLSEEYEGYNEAIGGRRGGPVRAGRLHREAHLGHPGQDAAPASRA
jgi:hypothetical protein